MLNNVHCTAAAADCLVYAKADAVALFLCKECAPGVDYLQLPEEILATVKAYLEQQGEAVYEVESVRTLTVMTAAGLKNLLIVGCGVGSECKPNNFRKAAGAAVRQLKKLKAVQAAVVAPILLNSARAHYLQAVVEGLYLGAYDFTEFKSETKKAADCEISVVSGVEDAEKAVLAGAAVARAVCLARNLVNRPGNAVNPQAMAANAAIVAEEFGLELEVLQEQELKEKGMNAILAVGQGSVNKPCMITLKYNGAGDAPYIAYVGKGITFDSGGISIKPDDNMGEMKDDMTGAADVLAAIYGIARLGLHVNVMAVLACAENMPGGNAQRPGDIVKAGNGKTIEVVSTDAEGRMVLADGVWYACQQGARKVVDIATLTGAVIVALGKETSGIVGNDDALVASIKEAGHLTGESYWQLPSLPECKEAIKSDVADLLNSAGRAGGCITGGLFVGEFVAEGTPWAHIDIGGTSTAEKTAGHKVKGGTGFGTMTLIKLAEMI